MRIGVLTSSRADYGIYTNLIQALVKDPFFEVAIIAFGTHLSKAHGYTVNEIEQSFKGVIHKVKARIADGAPEDIALAYAETTKAFAHFWSSQSFDIVLCLGDRYEMSAAVQAGIPFRVQFAHFHGGETSQGAIDEIYRHQISLASTYHFTAAETFAEKVKQLTGSQKVAAVGSMSLSEITSTALYSRSELNATFGIPDRPYVLCTVHPETGAYQKNDSYTQQLIASFQVLIKSCHLVINPPNADTHAAVLRNAIISFCSSHPDRTTLVESFGKKGYFSAMKESLFLLGNSSSGIIEAASFGKFAINLGDRQKGRLQSGNVINVPFEKEAIVAAAKELITQPRNFSGENQYVKEGTINTITTLLKSIHDGTF